MLEIWQGSLHYVKLTNQASPIRKTAFLLLQKSSYFPGSVVLTTSFDLDPTHQVYGKTHTIIYIPFQGTLHHIKINCKLATIWH